MMRPFFKHYGSKWRLAGKAPAPIYDTIVEPFAGGAGYSCRYGAGRRVILVDSDPQVVMMWRWLISVDPAEVMALPVAEIHEGADIRELDLAPAPFALIQRWLTTQGSRSNYRMTPMGRRWVARKPGACWSGHIRERIATQVEHIRTWQVLEGDYTSAPDIMATWHVDPPYKHNREGRTAYGKQEALDYEALGRWCKSLRGQVMVHEQQGADWLPFGVLDVKSRTGRVSAGKVKRQVEVIWCDDAMQRRFF